MRGRGRIFAGRWVLTLAVGLIACAPARRSPPPAAPSGDPLTEDAPRDRNDRSPSKDPPLAPPPAYGHRVASRDIERGATQSGEADTPGRLAPDPARGLTCVDFWPEARFRNYAYDHLVHLLSRCDVRALCAVSSDVNPRPVDVAVLPNEHVEVLTFRGSPAREFSPRVKCRFVP